MANAPQDRYRASQVFLENHDVIGIVSRCTEQTYACSCERADNRRQDARHVQVDGALDHQRRPASVSTYVLRSKPGLADDRQFGGVAGDGEKLPASAHAGTV
jgi:hypothetical protein